MRSRSFTASQKLQVAPPAGLSHRYAALGILLVMASCTVSQPPAQFSSQLASGPVRGFQIQIHSTLDKTSAEVMLNTAESWWGSMEKQAQRSLFGVGYLPVEIKWLDPYYRVRIGHFRTREEARSVMGEIAKQFPAALVVPDTIL